MHCHTIKPFSFYSLCFLASYRLPPLFSLTSSRVKASGGQYLQMTRNKNSRSFKIHVKYIQIGLVKGSHRQHWGWLQFPWHKTMAVRFPWRKNKEGLRLVPRGSTLVLSIYRMYSYLPAPACRLSLCTGWPANVFSVKTHRLIHWDSLEDKCRIPACAVSEFLISDQLHEAVFLQKLTAPRLVK